MTPHKWPVTTNPADVLHEVRRGSEALIDGDAVDNAVAEWLAVTFEEMEGGAVEVASREDGEHRLVVVDGMDLPQADWTVALKVARAALERAEASR